MSFSRKVFTYSVGVYKNKSFTMSKNCGNSYIISRTLLTRPKEMDDMRKLFRERLQKNIDKDADEDVGWYGWFLLTFPVLTFGLGTWQIFRRKEKLELLQKLHERVRAEPVDIPEDIHDLEQMEYYPVKARGEFLYDREFVVGPKSLLREGKSTSDGKGNMISSGKGENKGYNIITPFKIEDRDLTILVNRGWVPNHYKNPEFRKLCRIEGPQEITGIVRLHESRPQFVIKNDPQKGFWQYRDLHQMSEVAQTDPVFIDLIEKEIISGMPIGSQTRISLRNEHMSYIVTWYGLALTTGYYWYRIYVLKRPIF